MAISPDGGLVFTPTINFSGLVTLTYEADNGTLTDTATVSLTTFYCQSTLDDGTPPAEVFPFLHVGHRYYDPATGRFLQRDPIGILGGSNVYDYVASVPTINVDPEGLFPEEVPPWLPGQSPWNPNADPGYTEGANKAAKYAIGFVGTCALGGGGGWLVKKLGAVGAGAVVAGALYIWDKIAG